MSQLYKMLKGVSVAATVGIMSAMYVPSAVYAKNHEKMPDFSKLEKGFVYDINDAWHGQWYNDSDGKYFLVFFLICNGKPEGNPYSVVIYNDPQPSNLKLDLDRNGLVDEGGSILWDKVSGFGNHTPHTNSTNALEKKACETTK